MQIFSVKTAAARFGFVCAICLLSCTSSENAQDFYDKFSDTPGKLPERIEQVVDVFQLNYGETVERTIGGKQFKFTVIDLVDNLMDCNDIPLDYGPFSSDFFLQLSRVYAYLQVPSLVKGRH